MEEIMNIDWRDSKNEKKKDLDEKIKRNVKCIKKGRYNKLINKWRYKWIMLYIEKKARGRNRGRLKRKKILEGKDHKKGLRKKNKNSKEKD